MKKIPVVLLLVLFTVCGFADAGISISNFTTGSYIGEQFTITGTATSCMPYTLPSGIETYQVLIVGGGGPGSDNTGDTGGGGAGGYREFTMAMNGSVTICVGAGGNPGTNGGDSSIQNATTTVTATGGGKGGGGGADPPGNGGSGGGTYYGGGAPGTGIAGQGYGGGTGGFGGAPVGYGGGGGGGASGSGGSWSTPDAGDGGAGTASSITGSSVTRAGGGGGGCEGTCTAGTGGSGGGGDGGQGSSTNGAPGTDNTGSGGGGVGVTAGKDPGRGGHGIVIFRWINPITNNNQNLTYRMTPIPKNAITGSYARTTFWASNITQVTNLVSNWTFNVTSIGVHDVLVNNTDFSGLSIIATYSNLAGYVRVNVSHSNLTSTTGGVLADIEFSILDRSNKTEPLNYAGKDLAFIQTNTYLGSSIPYKDPGLLTLYGRPIANMTSNATSGLAPTGILFTDHSSGDIDFWNLSFGDGNWQNGSVTFNTAPHSYGSAGTYIANLSIKNNLFDIVNFSQIQINIYGAVTTAFSGAPTSGTKPLSVTFTDASSGSPNAWNWSFGDGNFSILQNPSHTYDMTGTFDVRLYAENPYSNDWENKTGYITVTNVTPTPTTTPTAIPTTFPPSLFSWVTCINQTKTSIAWNITNYTSMNITAISLDGIQLKNFSQYSGYIVQSNLGPGEPHTINLIVNGSQVSQTCYTLPSMKVLSEAEETKFLTELNTWIYIILIALLCYIGLRERGVFSMFSFWAAAFVSLFALASWILNNSIQIIDIWHLPFLIYGALFIIPLILWMNKMRGASQ